MIGRIRGRLRSQPGDAGMTLVEVLVAATMSVVIVAGASAMLISAVRDQPALSGKAQNVSTARWQLERIVREIRNGIKVEVANPNEISIVTQVRRVACGGVIATDPAAPAIKCLVTYRCAGSTCTRTEAGTAETTVALTGVPNQGGRGVFCFVPSTAADPTECGTAQEAGKTNYVGVHLEVPNPNGHGMLTINDGANLRTTTLTSG